MTPGFAAIFNPLLEFISFLVPGYFLSEVFCYLFICACPPHPRPELFLHVCFLSGCWRGSLEAFSNATTCSHEMALVNRRHDGQPCSGQLRLGRLAEPSLAPLTLGPARPDPEPPARAGHSWLRQPRGRCRGGHLYPLVAFAISLSAPGTG